MKSEDYPTFLFSLVYILLSKIYILFSKKIKYEDHWLHHSKRIQTDIPE